ncbi:hypothetical protein RM550_26445 [Streptomyces sp. DSM 41527]|uniref:Uncharacterized protein n=1 Tax=Streptomyces mooreae TaxID=3075523 RepID=A0ABU2TE48_9ACTN|nr:hypothetical protein [Streptomyces sp. DSM 41527]MDT0459215.1 hypothetical protein [Streptomyces sp. DSM 41527]
MRYARTTVGGAFAAVVALGLLGSMGSLGSLGSLGLVGGSAAAASAGGASTSGVAVATTTAAVESRLTGSATTDRGAGGERVAFSPYDTVKSGDFRVRHVLPPLPGEVGK